jgi:hypothetical protein
MTLGQFQRQRRIVQARLTPYQAVLGDSSDNPYVGRGTGLYWVRPYDAASETRVALNGAPYRVRAGSALIVPRGGRVVWIGPGPDGRPTVIGYDHDDLVAAGIDPTSVQPNDPYRQWIRLKDVQNFRALPVATGNTPSLKVQVRQLFYYTATGDLVRWNGTNEATHIDLAAYVPEDGLQRYVVLWLRTYNPNGLASIQVTASSTISSVDDTLSFDELQECADAADADTTPIQAFRLANAQTTLKLDDTIDVDLRQFINMPQVYGFPNTVRHAYRIHEDFSVIVPSAITIEADGLVQIQDNALLQILGDDEDNTDSGSGTGGMTQLTGDGTAGPGGGSQALTLATVNSTPGTAAYPSSVTTNAKGLVTAIAAGSAPAPSDAHYLTTQAESGLSSEFNLGSLTTGLQKNTIVAGVATPSTAAPGTDYTTPTGAENLSGKAITGSTLDGTPIGTTTPDAGRFSSLRIYIGGVYAAILHAFTGSHTVTIPGDADIVLVGEGTAQSLSLKTLITPIIASFVNALHNHTTNAGGGQLTDAALSAPVGVAKGGSGGDMSATGGANFLVKQSSAGGAFTAALMVLADIPNLLITAAKIANATITLGKLANGTARKYIGFDSTGAASEQDAIQWVSATWGESVAGGSVPYDVYLRESDGKWYKIDSDSTTPLVGARRGFVLDLGASAGAINTAGTVILRGPLPGFSGLTAGGAVYASTTAGGITQTKPTVTAGGGQVAIAEMGWATTTTSIMVDPKPVRYVKRAGLQVNDTLTITHHSDTLTRTRRSDVYANTGDSSLAETFPVSNYDANFALEYAGGLTTIDNAGVSTGSIGNNAGTNFRLAESFTGIGGILTSFSVRFTAKTGSPPNPSWAIQSDAAGLPSGINLVNGTFGTITTGADNTVTVTDGPNLRPDITYHLVIQVPINLSSNNFWTIGFNTSSTYANGQLRGDSGTTSFLGTWVQQPAGRDMRCAITTATVDAMAQSINSASQIQVTSVNLRLKKVGSPTDLLTLSIKDQTGGLYPNSVITNGTAATVLASSLGTSDTWVLFTFYLYPVLSAGIPYYLELTTAGSASTTNYVIWCADASTPSYTPGQLLSHQASGWSLGGNQVGVFELYAISTPYEASVRDITVRMDDGSGANSDTKTTFKNVTATAIDTTVIVTLD